MSDRKVKKKVVKTFIYVDDVKSKPAQSAQSDEKLWELAKDIRKIVDRIDSNATPHTHTHR